MRKTALVLTLNLLSLLAWGHEARGQEGAQVRRGNVARDVKLEAAVARRHDGIVKLLRPEARVKLSAASRALLKEVVKSPGLADPEKAARAAVGKRFAGLSEAQLDLLSFCALADVVRYGAKSMDGGATKADLDSRVEQAKDDLDSMSEMGEMESLRLQMAMDRMSKMMSTLSNLLKKISGTAQSITQNIK